MNETSKKQWMRVAIGVPIGLIVLLLLVLFGRAVGTPDQHNPEVYGTVQIRLAPDWRPDERARMEPQLARLNKLGPLFIWAPPGSTDPIGVGPGPRLVQTALVNRGTWGPAGCQETGVAFYDTFRKVIWIDPVCAPGELLPYALGHELGHFLGMRHVCRSAGEGGSYECSPVGFDRASLMNPSVSLDPGTTAVMGGGDPNAPPPLDPSFKDLEEFLRVLVPYRPDASVPTPPPPPAPR